MKQYETIDWKHYAQVEQHARKAAQQHAAQLQKTVFKAQNMLQRIVAHCKSLKLKIQHLDTVNNVTEKKLHNAVNTLAKAKEHIAQRKAAETILQQENQLLKQTLAAKDLQLSAIMQDQAQTQLQLKSALNKIEFCNELNFISQPAHITKPKLDMDKELQDFFIYRNINAPAITDNLQ